MQYIEWFKDLNLKDIPKVGGKTASLGEMYSKLTKKGIKIPNGFALTADAYWAFFKEHGLDKKIKKKISKLNIHNVSELKRIGKQIREMILKEEFSEEIKKEIRDAYKRLSKSSRHSFEKGRRKTDNSPLEGGRGVSVAVRSSATAEDLPDASFAGQQETYLNVVGEKDLILACKKCIASLFTDRAISYREDKGFDHMEVALSVAVQEMVRSDLGMSGVMFTVDTESGFPGVVLINAAYGLGEYVVKGRVVPDQFYVYKNGLKKGFKSIISRRLGSKEVKLIYAKSKGTKQEKVKISEQNQFCLTDREILQLAKWGMKIEAHYGRAMDIEWAKDGQTGELFIVQARSETVKSQQQVNVIETYKLQKRGKILASGTSVGQKIGQGKVRIIESPKQMKNFKKGEVLVTRITDPDWEPIMRIAGAIITEQGGKTSHAAIVSRELGVPCLVGVKSARKLLRPGKEVTVSCADGEEGNVYAGRLPFEVERTEIKEVPKTKTKIMMNVGDPDNAFSFAAIPNDGVGLAREEFIFTNFIKIHPLALLNYKNLKDKEAKKQIKELTIGYKNKADYAVERLAEGIAFLATAFDGKDVILRFSDFKTNEYATLIGGQEFEPHEENPMLGWRGASRYYDPKYKKGFELECQAIKKVRAEWGLKNLIVMVPFCRTVEEGKKVLATMKEFGLERGKDGLKVYVMAEIPSNVILASEFSKIFDGFSIGSNDLTQLTLGVDRDSALVSHVYDENNKAVKTLIRDLIKTAHKNGCKVGICGQAPSDYPAFAGFLAREGVDSISLNPDTVLKTRKRIAETEKKLKNKVGDRLKSVASSGKLLAVLGVIGLTLILGGVGCESLTRERMIEEAKISFTNEMMSMKEDLKQEITQEIKNIGKTEYSEDSFAEFSFSYPMDWKISHWDGGVSFVGQNQEEWFTISAVEGSSLEVDERTSTTTFFGYEAKRFNKKSPRDGEIFDILEIETKNGLIEISGSQKYFDDLVGGFSEFNL